MRKTLALLFVLTLSACQGEQEIKSNLSESDANEILVVLNSQKIPATKLATISKMSGKQPSYAVNVQDSQAAQALQILVDNRLPKPRSAGLGEIYPSDSSSLIPSQSEEKAKFLRAVQGEVENMLKVLPGIIEARVVLVVPDQNVIRDLRSVAPKATASVAVVYNPIDAKGSPAVKSDEIKYLVASAVENLLPASVTVVMSENHKPVLLDTFATARLSKKAESTVTPAPTLREKIKANTVPGAGNHLLLWAFGILGVMGLMLGIFGMIRNKALRDQLNKALNAHEES